MEESSDQRAALSALSESEQLFLEVCDQEPELLEKLEQLQVITRREKEIANDKSDFRDVLAIFKRKVENDSQIFIDFCRNIRELDDAKELAANLLGEYWRIAISSQSIHFLYYSQTLFRRYFLFRRPMGSM